MPSDLRTHAIVLRRTNYGESDRILNLLTPEGKISVLAKGVRKAKSHLAGSIELFTMSDVVVHQGRSNLGTLTSAKMLKFYSGILNDVARLELAADFMRKVERAAEAVNNPDFFSLLTQGLDGLNRGLDLELVRTWFVFNLARASGEEFNLIYDIFGEKLLPETQYYWDVTENALRPDITGRISAREIKFVRFLLTNSLLKTAKIENFAEILPKISPIIAK